MKQRCLLIILTITMFCQAVRADWWSDGWTWLSGKIGQIAAQEAQRQADAVDPPNRG
jgi:hypothetical protein